MLDLPSCSRETSPPLIPSHPRRGFPTPVHPSCLLHPLSFSLSIVDLASPSGAAPTRQDTRETSGVSMDELFTRLCRRVTVCRPVRLQGQAALLTRARRKRSFLTASLYLELASGFLRILFEALPLDRERIIVWLIIECSFYNVVVLLLSDSKGVAINFAILNPKKNPFFILENISKFCQSVYYKLSRCIFYFFFLCELAACVNKRTR